MTQFVGHDLHQDDQGVKTSRRHGDIGDTTEDWFGYERIANGGDVAKGATTNAAQTDPTQTATVISLLKGLLTALRVAPTGMLKLEDAAAASGDAGVMALAIRRDAAGAGVGADGDYGGLAIDSNGYLRVRVENAISTDAATTAPSNANSGALASNLVVKAAAGRLFGLQIYNNLGSDQFIQIHDAAALPLDGAVPAVALIVAANSNFSIDFGSRGRAFATGIVVCNSSSLATKTIGAADLWIDAQYE